MGRACGLRVVQVVLVLVEGSWVSLFVVRLSEVKCLYEVLGWVQAWEQGSVQIAVVGRHIDMGHGCMMMVEDLSWLASYCFCFVLPVYRLSVRVGHYEQCSVSGLRSSDRDFDLFRSCQEGDWDFSVESLVQQSLSV
jgi:hypothetical protein